MTEPLRLSFEVACPVEHAFTVWTEGIATWWPADHTASGDPGSRVVLEGRPGGRIYERTPSGEEHEWGEVVLWQPPSALGYLWFLRTDRSDATDVTVRFTATGARATRVDIEHAGWERLGGRGAAWRERNLGGWTTLLPHFRRAVAQ
ncbi:SRPBCC domain-containing protein [Geodermatophilus sp. YIM 151500]|uniref:SRPBCC domain-containing protein n=1 Tax=Geodermatophilus sp. YIM 151500 TaxID=2984531 RepID=UPI0021E3A8D6|nr:SRPBCC domain-containing protein [Geodermatophilus sp. YIM 151500]MCV2491542.1 SRPBCC domain-containing protein [Geodermatophilus sp. YIM 151500]